MQFYNLKNMPSHGGRDSILLRDIKVNSWPYLDSVIFQWILSTQNYCSSTYLKNVKTPSLSHTAYTAHTHTQHTHSLSIPLTHRNTHISPSQAKPSLKSIHTHIHTHTLSLFLSHSSSLPLTLPLSLFSRGKIVSTMISYFFNIAYFPCIWSK